MSVWLLVLVMFVLANLPWCNQRLFLVVNLKHDKNAWWRLLEVLIYYFIALLIAIAFETQFSGNIYQQGWEFFVTTLCLFLVFAVPGVIYRHQWIPLKNKLR